MKRRRYTPEQVIGKLREAGYKPEHVAAAVASKVKTLRRSLTWDQGPEMRNWKQVRGGCPTFCVCGARVTGFMCQSGIRSPK